jgi:hypothetical protein
MNEDHSTQERQKLMEEAAASFAPPCPNKYEALLPFQESIATLRRKGASYRTITDILHTVKVSVSLDTVARFCREMIEQRQPRKTKRRAFVRTVSEQTSAMPQAHAASAAPHENGSASQARDGSDTQPNVRAKGPRIADPNNV